MIIARSAETAKHPEFWQNGLVSAYCPLLGPTGNRVFDWVSGRPMDVTLNYASNIWAVGKGLYLNGNTSLVNINRSVTNLYPKTVIASVRVDATSGCIHSYVNGVYYIGLFARTSGIAAIDYSTAGQFIVIGTPLIGANEELVAAAKFETNKRVCFYNGLPGSPSTSTTNNSSFTTEYLGRYTQTTTWYFNGLVKTVLVYNHALSDQTIGDLSRTLKQDPLAPFRRREPRRYFQLDLVVDQTATVTDAISSWTWTSNDATVHPQATVASEISSWTWTSNDATVHPVASVADAISWTWSSNNAVAGVDLSAVAGAVESWTWAVATAAGGAVLVTRGESVFVVESGRTDFVVESSKTDFVL